MRALLRGNPDQNYGGAFMNAPGVNAYLEQVTPGGALDAQFTDTRAGMNFSPADWASLMIDGGQYANDFYKQQNIGAELRGNIPVGDATVSPAVRFGANRSPGEWGTQGWQADPVQVGGQMSVPVGDGRASFDAMKPRGQGARYRADYATPVGNGFDLGASAEVSPGEQAKNILMMLNLTKRF